VLFRSFEPFSRTAYWRRQREKVTFPVDGEVYVVVWSSQGSVGRYSLVVGQREVRGGDSDFARKLKAYWTPVELPAEGIFQPKGAGAAPLLSERDGDPVAMVERSPQCPWYVKLLAFLFGSGDIC